MRKYVIWGIIAIFLIALFVFKPKKEQTTVVIKTTPNSNYVALGDSISAGVGLQDDSDYSACDRTNQSYPNLISDSMHLKLYNLSCSGATLSNGILDKQNVNGLLTDSQLDQLYKISRPKLVTITVGANDIKWTDFIRKCYSTDCANYTDTYALDGLISQVETNLSKVLSQINSHYASSKPIVLITGYYQPFPSKLSSCSDLTGINSTKLAWMREQQSKLNFAISETASNYSFVKFVPISYVGHELCSPQSWVQGLSDSQPFHPTADGQKAYAKQIEAAYNKLGSSK